MVTNLGIMRFSEDTKTMYLAEYYPGVTVENVVENTGFEIDTATATESTPPSDEELRVLREEIDPQRLILG